MSVIPDLLSWADGVHTTDLPSLRGRVSSLELADVYLSEALQRQALQAGISQTEQDAQISALRDQSDTARDQLDALAISSADNEHALRQLLINRVEVIRTDIAAMVEARFKLLSADLKTSVVSEISESVRGRINLLEEKVETVEGQSEQMDEALRLLRSETEEQLSIALPSELNQLQSQIDAQSLVEDALVVFTNQLAFPSLQAGIDALGSIKEQTAEIRNEADQLHDQTVVLRDDAAQAVIDAQAAGAAALTAAADAAQALEGSDAAKLAAETARAAADAAQAAAADSASVASASATSANTKAGEAAQSAAAASVSATTASTKAGEAASSASGAATSATNAAASQTAAGSSATAAQTARTGAETAKGQAEAARTEAVAAQETAQGAATTATSQAGLATSARDAAAGSATAAATSASTASTKAGEAATSASTASTQAGVATSKAGEASTSAAQAAQSKTDAAGSASTATTQATNAANSASAAAGSASAASSSASTATTKASEAGTAATTATTQAGTATTKAGEAATSASAAATSASNAAGSATAASTSATTAANARSAADAAKADAQAAASAANTSATNAAASASDAGQSATTASTQAGIASTKAGEASTSASQAAQSRTDAAGSASVATTQATTAANARADVQSALNASGAITSYRAVEAMLPFTAALTGLATAAAPLTTGFANDTAHGPYLRRPATAANNAVNLLALAPAGQSKVYRVRMKIRAVNAMSIRMVARLINPDGTNPGSAAVTTTAFTAGEVKTLEAIIGPTSGGLVTNAMGTVAQWNAATGVRFGADNSAAVSGGNYDVFEISYEDLTAADAAARSASAAAGSASAAASSASTATSKATEASTSAATATTQAGVATSKAGEASTSATQAAQSKTDAAGSASTASTQATNAANSANAAAGSAAAANTSAGTASTKASEASTSATAAAGSASTASTKAGEASTSANQAATSASNASGSATQAATQATTAARAAEAAASFASKNLLGKQTFEDGDKGTWTGTVVNVPATHPLGRTKSLRLVSQDNFEGNGSVGTYQQPGNVTQARIWRMSAYVCSNASAIVRFGWWSRVGANPSYAAVEAQAGAVVSTWQLIEREITIPADAARTALWPWIQVGLASGGTTREAWLTDLKWEDITEQKAAEAAASAAQTSATNAQASATAAGSSASTASTQAGIATTKAGEASTSAGQAAQSKTDAAGSASTAATQATNAANSANAAGQSATAASGSASTASTKASEASTSASAANTAKTAAETARGQAQTAQTAAATSATNAAGSATAAATSATVAATAQRQTVMENGNFHFDHGITGWSSANTGTNEYLTNASVLGSWEGMQNVIVANSGARLTMFSIRSFPILPNRKYRVGTRFKVLGAGNCQMYVGVRGVKADGSLSGTNNSYTTISGTQQTEAQGIIEPAQTVGVFTLANLPADTVAVKLMLYGNYNTTSGVQVGVDSLYLEDVTESQAASVSASAAATSASNASTAATTATNQASASTTAKTQAETARTGAQNAQTAAETARTQAQTAQTNAATSASNAATSASTATAASLAAAMQISGGHASNPIFSQWPGTNPDGILVGTGTGNSLAKITGTNARYVNALNMVCGGTSDGPYISINRASQGLKMSISPTQIRLRLEVEIVSGSVLTSGAILRGQWNDSAVRMTDIPLKDVISNTVGTIQTIDIIMDRPAAAVPASATNFHVFLYAGTSQSGGRGAFTLRVHRFDFEEILGSSVASITQKAVTDLAGMQASLVALRSVAGSATAELELVSMATPEGAASGIRMRADQIIMDGTVNANHLNVDWLNAGRISASYLDVDSMLTMNPGSALRYNKLSANDENDGLYFGTDPSGNFGFHASRTNANNKRQSVALTNSTGLRLLNARHFVSGVTAPVVNTFTGNTGINSLPAGTTSLRIEAIGGGAGGASGWSNGNVGANNSGGTTTVEIFNGGTLIGTYVAAGGVGPFSQKKGEDSALGAGGAAGASSSVWIPPWSDRDSGGGGYYETVITRGGDPAAGAYGAGGGASANPSGARGGRAGSYISTEISLAGVADPRYRITIGGGGGYSQHTNGEAYRSGNGRQGWARLTSASAMDLPADVVPLRPTATGHFTKVANQAGSFPNHGAGLWLIWKGDDTSLYLGGHIVIAPGENFRAYIGVSTLSFFSAQTPTYESSAHSSGIHYKFYAMGNWG